MGLLANDRIPDISLREAYKRIRSWYKKNIDILKAQDDYRQIDSYPRRSEQFISVLPSPSKVSELEARFVFANVISNLLEWAYHKNDGEYKMAAYAYGGLKSAGFDTYSLNEEELLQLKDGCFGPFICL